MGVGVFELLHPKIKEVLRALDIREPTPPQKFVIPPILNGENVLLIAPTASGKTEAAILPVFHSYISGERSRGISIIYITPLRALNRDINRRMMFWGDQLDIGIEVRHGDTKQKQRRRQSSRPPEMLITTPETLQAILPTKAMRHHLESVRWVIVDEIHDLASSKRGAQLSIGLERLERLTYGPIQRIGLSATVGNPREVAAFLGGAGKIRVFEVEFDKSYVYSVEFPEPSDEDFDLADELDTTPMAASRLNKISKLVKEHNSTLIFVQGRGQAESLGHRLSMICDGIEVHHGSLSREQRHRVEDDFKAGRLKAIVCTSTLQLGIDVGEVDLCIQYLSPRQVNALIQRVGRAGHTLDRLSKGVTITAYGEDALESIVTAEKARRKQLEPTLFHVGALDVLSHQIVGLTLFEENGIALDDVFNLVRRAYPYRGLILDELKELIEFLHDIGLIIWEGERLRRRGRGRKYYYENLGMIRDERRYPFINAVTEDVIGTVGDEFWSLRARLGLNVILKGRVWRIIHIDEERGVLHALPSDDPLGALPGWDGELIPVPKEIATQVASLREEISEEVLNGDEPERAIQEVARRFHSDEGSIRAAVAEAESHRKEGIPLPTESRLLLEVYDKYLIIHSPYGENVNRTLSAVLDSLLSENDLIYGWWSDPYRILIEAPRKLDRWDLERVEEFIRGLTPEGVERYLEEFLEARFPFAYLMKFIAERFGVIPRGKTMGPNRLDTLYRRFRGSPIYRETLREIYQEKLDLQTVKEIANGIQMSEIDVESKIVGTPSSLARHILEKYAEVEELMLGEATAEDQLEYMKRSISSRIVELACIECGEWHGRVRIRDMDDRPACALCGSGLLAMMRKHQEPEAFLELLYRWKGGEDLVGEEKEILMRGRRTADMILSYGKKAVIALRVYGVGPVTSYRVLSKMHRDENEFYSDLIKAKIQYIKTRRYWDDK